MRFSEALIASAAAIPFVAAHGGRGIPKIWGMGPGVKKEAFGPVAPRHASSASLQAHGFSKRQADNDNTGGQCGPAAGGAKCAPGYGCSPSGWCGNTPEYTNAPDCLIDYGPGCDANKVPNGESTLNVARPKLGNVEYGDGGLYSCTEPGTVAITYDDGPYIYTDYILNLFEEYKMKATFFITGINNGKGAIDDASTEWPAVISKMYAAGHQIASHTWSHQDLSAITKQQRIDQIVHNEMAIRNIIQKFPTYMRPPYSSCDKPSGCWQDMKDLGYVVTYFDIDTDDYDNDSPNLIQNAKNNFNSYFQDDDVTSDMFLAIGHDIHEQTAHNLTEYMLKIIRDKGYRGVTVGECLGDPEQNWYRDSPGKIVTSSHGVPTATSSALPTATPTAVSTDGTCGGNTGFMCNGSEFGNCCSQAGWCGTSTDHCGTGCQSFFGTCGSSSSVSSASSVSSSASSAAPSSTPTGVSTDGTCGPANGLGCNGSEFGNCCSQAGWCGTSTAHCGTGCQSAFGTCGSSDLFSSSAVAASSVAAPSSTAQTTSVQADATSRATVVSSAVSSPAASASAPASVSGVPSKDGTCSGTSGYNCLGWSEGECCSQYGWCGNTADHCGASCNPLFGKCNSSPPVASQAPSANAPSTVATSVRPTSTTAAAPAKTSAASNVSTNGKCGARNGGKVCPGSKCCSVMGNCGDTLQYCWIGCQKSFGQCW